MSTKTVKKETNSTSKTGSKATSKPVAVKAEVIKPLVGKDTERNIDEMLKQLSKIEKTKTYYKRLKEIETILDNALNDIHDFEKKVKNEFYDNQEDLKFPFEIHLVKRGDFEDNVLFKINKVRTVSEFTEILFSKIAETRTLFEQELENYFNKIK